MTIAHTTTRTAPSAASSLHPFFSASAAVIGTACRKAKKLGIIMQREASTAMDAAQHITSKHLKPWLEQAPRDAARELISFTSFSLRTTLIPGRHNRPGTGNFLSHRTWTRKPADFVHAFGLSGIMMATAMAAAAGPADHAMQRPVDECSNYAGTQLAEFENRYADMTRLTGLRVFPTPEVYGAISTACVANGADGDIVAAAVLDRQLPAVDQWATMYDVHYAKALKKQAEDVAYRADMAERLALIEAEMPMRQAAAARRTAAIIAAHRPHPAVVERPADVLAIGSAS